MVTEEKQKQKYRTQWVNGSLQVVIRMEKVLIRERYCVLVLARGMNFKGHWLKNCWNLAPLYRFKASDFFCNAYETVPILVKLGKMPNFVQ